MPYIDQNIAFRIQGKKAKANYKQRWPNGKPKPLDQPKLETAIQKAFKDIYASR